MKIRKIIGVQSQEVIVDDDLTGRENLILQGHFQRMHGSMLEERVDELLKLVGLSDVADKRSSFYSGGMRKRLDLASALVHKPKLLFLDEPTTGLDPQSRIGIWSYLEKLNKEEGITIFLTTQYLEEADKLCHRLSIIDHGEIIVSGSPAELKQQVGGETITISLTDEGSNGEVKERAAQITRSIPGVSKVIVTEGGVAAYAKDAGPLIPAIVRVFDNDKIPVSSISLSSPTLDDVFLLHTGRRIRPQELNKRPSRSAMGRGLIRRRG